MAIDRIVSFFPSATELLYELGVGEKIYGVTHECIYPKEAKTKPTVISSVFDPKKMSSKQIDDKISELVKNGKEIYKMDEKNLIQAKPDLIISQETCEVCSAHSSHVVRALEVLDKEPDVFSINPQNIEEIFQSVKEIGEKIGRKKKANEMVGSLRKRIEVIENKKPQKRPKVLAIEWLDPFFSSGHWVPEMVEIAGGRNQISEKGEASRRIEFEEISKLDPEVIVLMPCGFDVKRTVKEYGEILKNDSKWNKLLAVQNNKVFVVDANSYFSKPSIRTITGIEILAKIIHPDLFEKLTVPENSFWQIS